jgi:ATP-dependent Clp protease adaptor protein ClpS
LIKLKYLNTMAKLVLYNDEKNSYMKVKASLIRFCEHMPLQADQCTLIAHNNGKVTIKEGDFMELLHMKNSLEKYDLKVELIQ